LVYVKIEGNRYSVAKIKYSINSVHLM